MRVAGGIREVGGEDPCDPLEMGGRAVASAGYLLQSRYETEGFYLEELRER